MSERISRLEAFLEQQPDDAFLVHALALEWIKAGDEMKAQELFERNLARDPGYVATYYHLAKLHERAGRTEEAIHIYEQGMEAAKTAGDNHSLSELRSAWEELSF